MNPIKTFVLSTAALVLYSCSSGDVAGNSSETGNCKVVGIVSVASDQPAKNSPVVLAPNSYTLSDSDSLLDTAWSDENGEYSFADVEPGNWAISVLDESTSKAMIRSSIVLEKGDSVAYKDTLKSTGTVEVIRADSEGEATVSIMGTPWGFAMSSGEVKGYISNLPAVDSLVVIVSSDTEYRDTIVVQENDTIRVTAGDVQPSAKISGFLNLDATQKAANAAIYLAPAGYSYSEGSDLIDSTFSDTEGFFSFEKLEEGDWTLFAVDTNSGRAVIRESINLGYGDSVSLTDTLEATGTVEVIRADHSSDMTIAVAGIPWGTTVASGKTRGYLTHVPAGGSVVVTVDGSDTAIVIPENDTLQVKLATEAILLYGDREDALKTNYGGIMAGTGYTLNAMAGDTVTVEHLKKAAFICIMGTPSLSSDVTTYIKNTAVSVMNSSLGVWGNLGISGPQYQSKAGTASVIKATVGKDFTHPIFDKMSSAVEENAELVLLEYGDMIWSTPSAAASKLLVSSTVADQNFCYAYETGDTMYSGTAPGKRVGFFIAYSSSLTADGLSLFNGVVNWLLP